MTDQVSKKQGELIQPDAYPQMLNKQNAVRALQTLQSQHVALKARTALKSYEPMLRDAIMDFVESLQEAGTDAALIFAAVHEIRNFAENAKMVTTGKIAEILARYMDEMDRAKKPADPVIVALHVAAIARAAQADDNGEVLGETVATELKALVARRLAEIGVA